MLQIETPQEAYVAIMYACMSVDETVTEDEMDELIGTIIKTSLFDNVDLISVYRKVQLINQANRFDAFKLIELASPLVNDSLKPVVYESASKLLLADGVVHNVESDLLLHLKRMLNFQQ